ncbi:hypothetical protein FPANT_11456 [Fusarium pseudoanthophilum]|uniref:Uncharacterized protein n=1 Tax=Fusarium pseudoanthophilum TaxID=48495 RepID=A0A8H5KL45_9HYPO|nr:hypothetical protein FPANT_11456 [Fusarium pseudoanthophilum]
MFENGIRSVQVATGWPREERQRIANVFNADNHYDFEVLITTFAELLNPAGPKYNGRVCHRGIMLETPDTLREYSATQDVVLGGEFTWDVRYAPGTLDAWRDLLMAEEAATAMMKDDTLFPELNGFIHQKLMVCYYDVALQIDKVESQYPRARLVHWTKLEVEEINREGLFYFELGKFLEGNRAAARKLDDQLKMRRIAAS